MVNRQLTDEDMEVVRSSLEILIQMRDAAEYVEDMQGEIVTEITQTIIMTRKEMAQIVEAKSLYGEILSEEQQDD